MYHTKTSEELETEKECNKEEKDTMEQLEQVCKKKHKELDK